MDHPLKKLAESESAKKAFSLLDEFKRFAFKGNMIDLAVGVIIGAAFAKIIDALVMNILMALISLLVPGEQSYVYWKFVINGKEIPYGLFLGELVNFLLVAFVLFLFIVKFVGWLTRARAQEAAAPPTRTEELLTEIRDLLKKKPEEAGEPRIHA
jgi:large conductance mechanosensitive channel